MQQVNTAALTQFYEQDRRPREGGCPPALSSGFVFSPLMLTLLSKEAPILTVVKQQFIAEESRRVREESRVQVGFPSP